jgi:hypothetical protein
VISFIRAVAIKGEVIIEFRGLDSCLLCPQSVDMQDYSIPLGTATYDVVLSM